MQLLRTLLLRRRVLQWLVPLVSLWVAIICGLAFSSAAYSKAEARVPAPALSSGRVQASIPIVVPAAFTPSRSTFQSIPLPAAQLNNELYTQRDTVALTIDGDPSLLAIDVLSIRPTSPPLERRLFVDGICQTPKSLMLHSSFGPGRMRELAKEILVRGLKTTTYREVSESLRRGECPRSNVIIVSLDDFGTDWLRPYFLSMIRPFKERGLKLVVAVNVRGPQDPDAWAYLSELEVLGNEVANHTIDHYNLARLEPNQVNWQIKGAHRTICDNLGRCPETLILPFGIIDANGAVVTAAEGYSYIVGIPGGREFGGESPYYMGRIAPDNYDQRVTVNELYATFGWPDSTIEDVLALHTSGCAIGPSPSLTLPLAKCAPNSEQILTADSQELHTQKTVPPN
ncbi:MAG: polysaccharide deacetylase family protein [Anaerolineales bacterium]